MTDHEPASPEAATPQEPDSGDGGGDLGDGLSDQDRAVLALEARGWQRPGTKERAIREQLGLSPTRYYQLLGALLDDPAALRHDPVTVNRLRERRAARRAAR
ncbi:MULTISPECIES: DUF3263 domain-containing protein [Streptomyces]|jgi:hypothetical protein|uniref:DUF3263 domain-containing protein n=1 Tax=Streptomyces fungicidicus TaxID=68203 RepID=A0ACC7Y7S2_9ACTN|nr:MULTISPECIES: DUF3263 domain-containing protein [Streptomyces]MBF4134830.1 DUF3263 domain-containing protein [Streptomyces albidoflavus]NUV77973.1 DUF3263 domain-containing protein [Streptomyces fungicidicus]PAX85451.1 hypothetical protein CLM81_13035 [Streptomyces albidoflavus]PAX91790.1 hypothetical protein CLM82_07325 [Streptomyces albidoflavus]PBO18388.1 hypothetical protein CLM83_12595 [Streptomyces albidoflavus]